MFYLLNYLLNFNNLINFLVNMKFFAPLAALIAVLTIEAEAAQTMMMSNVKINMAMIDVADEDAAKEMMEVIMASSIF